MRSEQTNSVMEKAIRYTQAYTQAPWRKQLRGIGVFLAIVLVFSLLGSLFISVTARTATLGKEIQRRRQEMESLEYEIAQLRSELAVLTSAASMRQRAEAMGFRPLTPDEVLYVPVPGYAGKSDITLADPARTVVSARPVISPAFTRSWVDWLVQQVNAPVLPLAELP